MWCVVLDCDCEAAELNSHVVFIAAAADRFTPSLNIHAAIVTDADAEFWTVGP